MCLFCALDVDIWCIMQHKNILIGHGSGGRLSRELINEIFVRHFSNEALNSLGDSSVVPCNSERLAFTTDSYVIDPLFFPGGDIGQLAVSGTVNDLSVAGAIPQYLSAGFIIEEGFPLEDLDRIAASMAREAREAGVQIVTGDTKVVKRGQCDKLFINTSGVGTIPEDRNHLQTGEKINAGDKIIVTGNLGDHAIAVLSARENLSLDESILSDAAPLNDLVSKVLENPEDIRLMRDITRGGLATVLSEVSAKQDYGIRIYEERIPVRKPVRSVCELYGFDPLYLANEGKIMMIVKSGKEEKILALLQQHKKGKDAAIIGEISPDNPSKTVMISAIGGKRIVDMLSGEMLPRIC